MSQNTLKDQVPPDLLAIPNVNKFTTVLSELQHYKSLQVDTFTRSFNPLKLTNILYLRKYLKEMGDIELVPAVPKKILENLIMNAYVIYHMKTTYIGFLTFLRAVTDGSVLVNSSEYYTVGDYIILDDYISGYLPDEASLPNAYENFYSAGNEHFLYLFSGDESAAGGIGNFEIAIKSPYSHIKEFRDWVVKLIPRFLPFNSEETTNIKIHFTGFDQISDIYLNNFIYDLNA